ncbi:hypothetical protein GO013_07700 [Pseudodesulfovibrio sp. JC047]|uniref:hypothetical protein n=1 Tax=Pseudodesulfovibrio sp. JC047 TaxID=2683199 RepID=UPI0013D62A14|nr:hypothetical protein [Pseudodesulfovibrio sp. JC047]NDV19301.1 hypothetical protein [Pseudodesulfovibrio sp. JC047]
MRIEQRKSRRNSRRENVETFSRYVVRFDGCWNVDVLEQRVRDSGLATVAFIDPAMFRDHAKVTAMCHDFRVRGLRVLWSATLDTVPTGGLLKAMRLAGCQRVEMTLDPDEAVEGLFWARHYGFDIQIRNVDGASYLTEKISYTVAEREAIADRLAGLHAAQFDLAVAYLGARRYADVMLPLGKAMTLGFPLNSLCLNLLACLSAAKQYPDQVAGLLAQAGNGCPHPVIFRNRALLKSWLESGGDLQGVCLELELAESASVFYTR